MTRLLTLLDASVDTNRRGLIPTGGAISLPSLGWLMIKWLKTGCIVGWLEDTEENIHGLRGTTMGQSSKVLLTDCIVSFSLTTALICLVDGDEGGKGALQRRVKELYMGLQIVRRRLIIQIRGLQVAPGSPLTRVPNALSPRNKPTIQPMQLIPSILGWLLDGEQKRLIWPVAGMRYLGC